MNTLCIVGQWAVKNGSDAFFFCALRYIERPFRWISCLSAKLLKAMYELTQSICVSKPWTFFVMKLLIFSHYRVRAGLNALWIMKAERRNVHHYFTQNTNSVLPQSFCTSKKVQQYLNSCWKRQTDIMKKRRHARPSVCQQKIKKKKLTNSINHGLASIISIPFSQENKIILYVWKWLPLISAGTLFVCPPAMLLIFMQISSENVHLLYNLYDKFHKHIEHAKRKQPFPLVIL